MDYTVGDNDNDNIVECSIPKRHWLLYAQITRIVHWIEMWDVVMDQKENRGTARTNSGGVQFKLRRRPFIGVFLFPLSFLFLPSPLLYLHQLSNYHTHWIPLLANQVTVNRNLPPSLVGLQCNPPLDDPGRPLPYSHNTDLSTHRPFHNLERQLTVPLKMPWIQHLLLAKERKSRCLLWVSNSMACYR